MTFDDFVELINSSDGLDFQATCENHGDSLSVIYKNKDEADEATQIALQNGATEGYVIQQKTEGGQLWEVT